MEHGAVTTAMHSTVIDCMKDCGGQISHAILEASSREWRPERAPTNDQVLIGNSLKLYSYSLN